MRKLRPILFALTLVPITAYPLGMGEIRLHSGLNQPFSAEIDLLSVTADELSSLEVGVPSNDAFAQLGIERLAVFSQLRFSVEKRADGSYYIRATTQKPVREAFLDFLVEVNWRSGRLVREYTVLLDPPELVNHDAAPAISKPAAAPNQFVERATPQPFAAPEVAPPVAFAGTFGQDAELAEEDETTEFSEAVVATDAAATDATEMSDAADDADGGSIAESPDVAEIGEEGEPAFVPEPMPFADTGTIAATSPSVMVSSPQPQPLVTGEQTYAVKKNETLWRVAASMRQRGDVTVEQVMVALVQANPNSFIDGNMHLLKAGTVLRLDPAVLASVSRANARREVAVQDRAWQDYRAKIAGKAPTRLAPAASESIDRSAVAASEEPRLKLVAPPTGKDAGLASAEKDNEASTAALQQKLQMAQEATEAQKQQNAELATRLKELEGQVSKMQRLMTLKDEELAALQRTLGKAQEPAATKPKAVEPLQADAKAVGGEVSPEADKTTAPEAAASAPAAVAPTAEPVTEAATPPAKAPAPAAKPKPVAPVIDELPAAEPQFDVIGYALENPTLAVPVLVAAFGVLGLLLAVVLRKRRGAGQFTESILMGTTPSMMKAKSGEGKGSDEASFFSDFAVSGMGDIQAEDSEVDPLTEADVYMAYQRFQQAEELIDEAIRHNPKRAELHLKLLEIHHATRNKPAFESAATKLHELLDGSGPLWAKALSLGHELLPGHPLFAQAPQGESASMAEHSGSRLDNDVLDIGLDLDALTQEMESGGSHGGFNVDLGVDFSDLEDTTPAARPSAASKPPAEEHVELDLGELSFGEAATAATGGAGSSNADVNDFGLGDFNLDELSTADAASSVAVEEVESSGGTEFELGDLDLGQVETDSEQPLQMGGAESGDGFDIGEFDLDSLGDDQLSGGSESDTKLDLARAYIGMGDGDGAKSLLEEVLQDGDDAQRQQAQELLKQIA